jgi:hypothetical protein|tara:strand:+ start:362 stop:619 length:258 start_codon:yes stop_codon:yes gene_type:complete
LQLLFESPSFLDLLPTLAQGYVIVEIFLLHEVEQSAEFFFIPVESVMLNDSGGYQFNLLCRVPVFADEICGCYSVEGTRNSIDKT